MPMLFADRVFRYSVPHTCKRLLANISFNRSTILQYLDHGGGNCVYTVVHIQCYSHAVHRLFYSTLRLKQSLQILTSLNMLKRV